MGILRILQMIIDSLKWHCLLNLNNNFQKFSPTLGFILAMTQACRWVTTNTAQDWLRKAWAANYYILPHSKTLLIFMMVQLCQPLHHQHGWTSRSVCVLVYGDMSASWEKTMHCFECLFCTYASTHLHRHYLLSSSCRTEPREKCR